ncbi:hypothetical protein PHO31112_04054 [Pandoraea horticolens]|uniref:Uncharacterized protein n=1 Tax=Pandoraea horticolens TaxID=2508298 RepID=A0A5E4XSA5_9BURK|nr:DUF2946 domain-containing protein [Pandoraea horticolens]VVE39196.1 hypothetical protein PHO31112_04054 [Pandoraea horticolens]
MLHRYRHLTAWLGVLAMWLAIAAPLVSQWRIAQAATSDVMVCSAEHGSHRQPDAGRTHDHARHLDVCGYCGFFAHSPAINAPDVAPFASVCVVSATVVATPPAVAVCTEQYPRAYPRAPPERA